MRIQHNIAALNSYRNYTNNTGAVSKNLEKLSSGYRINRAGDDAAGLAISEKMRAQITGLETAQKNAQDGVSLVQTAEGALTEVHSMLNRMVELANQSANGVYDNEVDRANLQKEFEALTDEIDRIADATNFNGINLLDGKLDGRYYGSLNKGVDDSGNKAGIDITFAAEGFKGSGLKIKFAKGTTDNTASVAADGVITITLSTTALEKGLSAKELQGIIKAANTSALNGKPAELEEMQAALKSLTVSGQGIIGLGKANANLADGMGSNIVSNKINPDSEALSLQIGDTADKYNQLRLNIQDMHANKLGLDQISVDNPEDAEAALEVLKNAINVVSSVRGDLGAAQNRLEHTINNLSVTSENMTAAESRIRDVDVAKEMMAYTKNNILVQSAQAMLAQANQQPQGVLQLLQ